MVKVAYSLGVVVGAAPLMASDALVPRGGNYERVVSQEGAANVVDVASSALGGVVALAIFVRAKGVPLGPYGLTNLVAAALTGFANGGVVVAAFDSGQGKEECG